MPPKTSPCSSRRCCDALSLWLGLWSLELVTGWGPCLLSPSFAVHSGGGVQGQGWRDVIGPAPSPGRPHPCPGDVHRHPPASSGSPDCSSPAAALGQEPRAHTGLEGRGQIAPWPRPPLGREAGLLPHMERPQLLPASRLCLPGSRDETACCMTGSQEPGGRHSGLGPRGRFLWVFLHVGLRGAVSPSAFFPDLRRVPGSCGGAEGHSPLAVTLAMAPADPRDGRETQQRGNHAVFQAV